MKTIDFSYFIERYLAEEMDEAEKTWFIKELQDNKTLRQEVELRRKTDAVIHDHEIMNLRSKLKAIEKKRAEPVIVPKKGIKRIHGFKYAAAFAVLITITAGILILSNHRLSSSEIMDKYYQRYEAVSTLRSDEVISNLDYNMAIEYYKINDFKNAALYFNKVIDNEPENMQSTLLNGISNFEMENYPVAEGSFEKVINNNNNYFIDHAQWYLALCYIQTGENQKAADQLSLIEGSKTVYSKKAKKILKSLK